jgi:exo-beta-1,3-glucanase (GH17 family)
MCYNPGHDWRDGFYPLTRKQLERDFQYIKQMGANTIRRYEPGIYDRNILNVAEEQGLNVMYGFWFDPAVDYYKDKDAVREYGD